MLVMPAAGKLAVETSPVAGVGITKFAPGVIDV